MNNENNEKRVEAPDKRLYILLISMSFLIVIPFCILIAVLNESSERDKDFENYINSENVDVSNIKDIPKTKKGILKIIDTYRKPLYDVVGNDTAKKLKELKSLTVGDVKDDGDTLTINVYFNDTNMVVFDERYDSLNSRFFLSSDFKKFIISTAYAFKDDRDIKINVDNGYFKKNEYNKKVYVTTDSYGMYFKKHDLSRVVDWNTYSFDKLLILSK